ncbi:unnamed protein product [Rotaria sordida]|uniref:Uncharacterized protein n=1 Tax=Rotaria sordida TaxID=392033 RepID=A0A813SUY1_9BILA|nr:unnamed protein product [Rotaria sordida]
MDASKKPASQAIVAPVKVPEPAAVVAPTAALTKDATTGSAKSPTAKPNEAAPVAGEPKTASAPVAVPVVVSQPKIKRVLTPDPTKTGIATSALTSLTALGGGAIPVRMPVTMTPSALKNSAV